LVFLGGAAADGGRRADDDARPRIDEIKGPTVVIDSKLDMNCQVIAVGDGTIMMVKRNEELKCYLAAMRREGKSDVVVRAGGDLPYTSVREIVEDAKAAGFNRITLEPLPKK
jgi:biopolymer transport protein ExbD